MNASIVIDNIYEHVDNDLYESVMPLNTPIKS